ncbi:PEP/pyruvate-binding domain-containing protein [Streptomyces sp. NPDC002599]|uniref:PEP/pyruvate-binding domain-containing protein n=1 Tax=Streptomyces sp. NPDC002599 TaxID=3154421 RepID=UPI00331FCF2C
MLILGLAEAAGLPSELLGGKGSGLAKLARLGLPVPPAFILTTAAYQRWFEAGFRVDDGLRGMVELQLEQLRPQAVGMPGLSAFDPFLVSVRSSPIVSMPGMLNSVLNTGVSQDWLEAQPASFGSEILAEFTRSYLMATGARPDRSAVTSIPATDAEPKAGLRAASQHAPVGAPLLDQVTACIDAVFLSNMRRNVAEFTDRRLLGGQVPIACIVQMMVYGNRPEGSASGVLWSRNIQSGEGPCEGTYLVNAQGPEVVGSASVREPRSLLEMRTDWPDVFEDLCRISNILEAEFPHVQEVEFTVDGRRVWLLQTRDVSLSPPASVRYACSKVDAGMWTPAEAVLHTRADALPRLTNRAVSAAPNSSADLLARGVPASAGIATGPLVLKPDETDGSLLPDNAILLAESLNPQDDFGLMKSCAGFITIRGGPGTHTAALLRKLGKPYVVSLDREIQPARSGASVRFGVNTVEAGDTVTVLGSRGELFRGELRESEDAGTREQVERFAQWTASHGSLSSWQVFNYPGQHTDHSIRSAVESVVRRNTWKSEKAVVTELLSLVPAQWRIRQEVFPAGDRDAIRNAMLSGIEAGFWIGPKVCRTADPHLGNGPWQTGIKTAEEVDSFLQDPAYSGRSPHGGYLSWVSDTAVTELVVVFDPPGKGEPELDAEHFVCTLSCAGSPAQLQIVLMLGTSRLRSLESASPHEVILVTVEPDYQHSHYLGQVRPFVGRDYWIGPGPGRFAEVAMSRGELSFNRLHGLVDERSLVMAEEVTGLIVREFWKPPFDLPHYMVALDDEFGLEILEFQGRADSGGRLAFFKLFDAKGHEEQLFIDRA